MRPDTSGSDIGAVEITRPARTLHVVFRHTGNGWQAGSPDLRRLDESGDSLTEVVRRTRARLESWLDPAVRVVETVVAPCSRPSSLELDMVWTSGQRSLAALIGPALRRTKATPHMYVSVEQSPVRVSA